MAARPLRTPASDLKSNRARRPPAARSVERSERSVEDDVAGHTDLIGGDAALEEVRDLLNIMEIHEAQRVLRPVALRQTKRREALVGAELEVPAHALDREPCDASAEQVLGELRLARDCVFDHVEHGLREFLVE